MTQSGITYFVYAEHEEVERVHIVLHSCQGNADMVMLHGATTPRGERDFPTPNRFHWLRYSSVPALVAYILFTPTPMWFRVRPISDAALGNPDIVPLVAPTGVYVIGVFAHGSNQQHYDGSSACH